MGQVVSLGRMVVHLGYVLYSFHDYLPNIHVALGELLHIIFVTPMTVNDVNLSFVLRRINGMNP
jgi:hypothetical protein